MKKGNIIPILLLFIAAISNGCSPVMYSTVGQNVPMFKEKDELTINAAYAVVYGEDYTDGNGLGIQAAYAISNKWAAMASYYNLNNLENPEEDEWNSHGSYFELGGGYYGAISKKFRYEVFGGLGYGSISNKVAMDNVDVSFLKPFIQPSAGFVTRYFDFIFTPRVSFITFTSYSCNIRDKNLEMQANAFCEENKNALAIEPGFTMRIGADPVKLQLQYNRTSFDSSTPQIYPVNRDYFSIGLHILISNKLTGK
jgi:hypothetical protein